MVSARNDDYGGNFIHRMKAFAKVLGRLCEKYNLNAELVIVEWNPLKNKPPLKDVVDWSKYFKSVKVKIIEVPNKVHQKIPKSDKADFFEFIAKNVGIRRARGEYILSTNADILFNDELIEFFALKKLSKEKFYRIDRYDVYKTIPLDLSAQEQLDFSEAHIFERKSIKGSTFYKNSLVFRLKRLINYYKLDLNTRLKVIRRAYSKSYKFQTEKAPNHFISNLKQSIHYKRVINFILETPYTIVKTIRAYLSTPYITRSNLTVEEQEGIHTYAAGDFFLMAKEHWQKLRGFPEFSTSSYIDGYICFMAVALGLQQFIFQSRYKIYHQNHHGRDRANRPATDFEKYQEDARRILKSKQSVVFNNEDWGLGNEILPEYQM